MTTSTDSATSAASTLAALQKATSGGASSSKTTSAADMQTNFLNLLVTQLKNQDPLNPMDNSQMTTQLSQISTVSGIEKLNATMQSLLGAYSNSQNMQAASMIGKTVLTSGSDLQLGTGGALGGVDLASAVDKVVITIKDANGKVVNTQNLGAQSAGTLHFAWDGTDDSGNALTAGKYSFSVAASKAGTAVDATALNAGTVTAVTLAASGLSLQLDNNNSVGYSDVKQILN
jgi:flagellar basal-body rod modification protein FlgD